MYLIFGEGAVVFCCSVVVLAERLWRLF